MKKKQSKEGFKKDFGNASTSGYSKEYMRAYCSWLKTLKPRQRKMMETYNDRIKTKKQQKEERKKLKANKIFIKNLKKNRHPI